MEAHDYDEEYYNLELDHTEFDPNELLPDVSQSDIHKIWCWGKNTNGELSQKSTKNVLEPVPLKKNITRPISISTGGKHTGIVDGSGKLYLCGNALFGK